MPIWWRLRCYVVFDCSVSFAHTASAAEIRGKMAMLGVDTDIAAAFDPGELLNPSGASTGADVQSDSALGSGSDQYCRCDTAPSEFACGRHDRWYSE